MKTSVCLAAIVLTSCMTSEQQEDAAGVFIRLVTIDVDSVSIPEWTSAVRLLARAKREHNPDGCCEWLMYREGAHRFHVILQSDSMGDVAEPEDLLEAFAGTDGEVVFRDGLRRLQATRYVVSADVLHQMDFRWSTVTEMDVETNPKASLTRYWVRSGRESDFDEAVSSYVRFLEEIEYPYPVEGFRWRIGSPGMNYLVVFPDAWEGFLEWTVEKAAHSRGRDGEYRSLLAGIARTVSREENHRLDYVPDMSS